MKQFPKSLQQKLQQREEQNALRQLPIPNNLIDFASNDYIGFAKNETIFHETHRLLLDKNIKVNGATGSRLLSGNHIVYEETEAFIAEFHRAESALIFNSGYDANIGFFSAVPQRNDIILYDELCHASIRDGIQMGNAKSFKLFSPHTSRKASLKAIICSSLPPNVYASVLTKEIIEAV